MNFAAVDKGQTDFAKVEVPASWKDAVETAIKENEYEVPEFIKNVLIPMNSARRQAACFNFPWKRRRSIPSWNCCIREAWYSCECS